MQKKRLFITGTKGFIGRNLTEFFTDKYHLFIPSHRELELLNADKVRHYIIANKINYIIHTANVGGERTDRDKRNIVYTNLRMFFNIARNEQYIQKIIYIGSGAEYDKSRPLKNISEEDFDERVPTDDYGFYKYICSKYILQSKTKKIISLRLFGIYGPYEDYLVRFISNSILKNIFNQPIIINQNVYFDYLYIHDLLRVIDFFLNNFSQFNIYNVTSREKTDLKTIAEIINEISNFKSEIVVVNPGLNYEYTGSNKRLMKEVKNFEMTSLKEGIGRLYTWYQRNLDKIDRRKVISDEYIKLCKVKKNS